jgi:DNA replication initiation complex subunit (GINS family)
MFTNRRFAMKEMDIILLKDLLDKERSKQALQPVDKDVYKEIKEYFNRLRRQINEIGDASKKKLFLIDELNSAEKIFNFFFEKRLGKIINIATRLAKGTDSRQSAEIQRSTSSNIKYSDTIDNLTTDEEKILDLLIESIRSAREIMLNDIYKDEEEEFSTLIENIEKKSDKINTGRVVDKNKYRNVIVRAIEDIPGFVDIDRKKYIIRREDIVVLSDKVADMLLKKNLVVKINAIIED